MLTGVTARMKVATEETFGPVAPVLQFDTEESAIRLANQSDAFSRLGPQGKVVEDDPLTKAFTYALKQYRRRFSPLSHSEVRRSRRRSG